VNRELIEALQNSLLFSLYARIVTATDLPLAEGGRVTAFQVIREFWQRRVRSPSEGLRAIGPSEESAAVKRQAIVYLVKESVGGKIVIRLPDNDAHVEHGIRMLLHEGVLSDQGSHAVRWFHDWIREFALVDSLIAGIEAPGPAALADAICQIAIDHVARTSAVAGAKWVIGEETWGPIETYLSSLAVAKRGFASEALAVLIEESPRHVRLNDLPDSLLHEAVEMARLKNDARWADQIAALPATRFASDFGDELLSAVNQYEFEVQPRGQSA
jgi:hypothetical protein